MQETLKDKTNESNQAKISKVDELNENAHELRYTDTQQALCICNESHDLALSINYDEGLYQSLLISVVCLYRLGKYSEALLRVENALRMPVSEKNHEKKINAISLMGNIYGSLGKYQKALNAFDTCADYYKNSGPPKNEGITYTLMGCMHFRLGDYVKSLKYHLQAFDISEKLNHQHLKASSLHNLAVVNLKIKDTEKALKYFSECAKIFRTYGDRGFEANSLGSISRIHHESGNLEKALKYAFKSLKLNESAGHEEGLVTTLMNIGKIYLAMDDPDNALKYQLKSLDVAERSGGKFYQAAGHKNLGKIYSYLNQLDNAENYYVKSLGLAEEVGSKTIIAESHEKLAEMYEQSGNIEKALYHYKRFHGVKESMLNEETEKQVRLLKIRFETGQKEKENEIFRMKIEQQRGELASLANTIAKQNELVRSLRKGMERFQTHSGTTLQEMHDTFIQLLNPKESGSESWVEFQSHFDSVFPDFINLLKEKHPSLTKQEINICSLIKIKMTSRNIARVLYITKRCVDWHRNKLRKKLNIAEGGSLYKYLSNF